MTSFFQKLSIALSFLGDRRGKAPFNARFYYYLFKLFEVSRFRAIQNRRAPLISHNAFKINLREEKNKKNLEKGKKGKAGKGNIGKIDADQLG